MNFSILKRLKLKLDFDKVKKERSKIGIAMKIVGVQSLKLEENTTPPNSS